MAANKWRLKITNLESSNKNYCRISEIQFRSAIGGASQSVAGTATASTQFPGQESTKAFDGLTNTNWASNNVNVTVTPQTIEYDHSSSIDVLELYIRPNNSISDSAPSDFTVEYYDGSTWVIFKTIAGVTGWASGIAKVFSFVGNDQLVVTNLVTEILYKGPVANALITNIVPEILITVVGALPPSNRRVMTINVNHF